jgi:dihydrofolate synthase/folylpolyglutamate synthase
MPEFYEEYLKSLEKLGVKFGLERTRFLAEKLGNPQNDFKCIIVGGTNGKGSVCAMLSSILVEAGFKTGMYTSPHLVGVRERIQINGKEISKKDLNGVLEEVKSIAGKTKDKPTFFEVLVSSALKYFSEKGVKFAVLEVGLGGRLDSTNIVEPELAIITNVELEHTKELGDTLEGIAREKADIIKGKTLVTAEKRESILKIFEKNASRVIIVEKPIRKDSSLEGQSFGGYWIPFLGEHQLLNAAVAMSAANCLGVKDEAIKAGLKKARWPGRVQIMRERPLLILDGAHNPSGAKVLAKALREYFDYDRLILVLGIMKDKDIGGIIMELPEAAEYILTRPETDRAAQPLVIKKYTKKGKIIDDIPEALSYAIAIAEKRDLVCVTGSLYTVAEALKAFKTEGG